MARWEIEKVAAAHLLEALKASLDHIRDFTMSGQAADLNSGRSGSATYAQLRRLRTYVQRCVSAYSDLVEFDLNEDDQDLLAACAIFEIANLDRRLGGPTRAIGSEIEWLEGRRRALSTWAVAFATRKIEHIPVADESVFLTTTVQSVLREIQRRVVAAGQRSGLHRVTYETAGAPTVPSTPPEEPVGQGWSAPTHASPPYGTPSHPAPRPHAHSPAAAPYAPPQSHDPYQGAHPVVVDPHHPAPPPTGYPARPEPPAHGPRGSAHEFGIPSSPHGAPSVAPAGYAAPPQRQPSPPPPQPLPPTAQPNAPEAVSIGGLDLDPRKLHDPRVRSMLHLDLRAFDRALRGNDHRMCVVHLGSILEAACIDYALAHRRELALSGAPESWNLEVVVGSVLGGEISSMDRALLFHLNAARNLLRPAIQLSNPMVVTAGTQAELMNFVRRVLTLLGYVGNREVVEAQAGPSGPVAASSRPSSGALPSWLRGSSQS